ncbi:MAG TPA: hypothetical protein VGD78_13170, partial [Chthoniobacterales bacterium]
AGSISGQRPDRIERARPVLREEQAPVDPAPVQIDFLPEERAFVKIIQQIKAGHVAYPLFGLARMFLERPERHRVRVRSLDNQKMLYQLGNDGPVATEPAALERLAFPQYKDEYYESETVEKEPIKGNFTSVARCTLSGRLLGPTNYHTFQTTLRSLYEQRYSRRMTFEDYRRTIEISTNPAVVDQWKEEARKATVYRTKDKEEPLTFDNLSAVEEHFRSHYLGSLVKTCLAAETSGDMVRHYPDRGIVAAVRIARDRENRFPAQMAGALRHGLNQANLHVFKHKKRILYISTVRPQPLNPNHTSLSTGLAAVLAALRSYPKITRKQLAEKVLSKVLGRAAPDEATPEYQQAKTNLAGDLIWLAKAGHVIEFADGTLDLPLPPKAVEDKPATPKGSSTAGSRPASPPKLPPLEAQGVTPELGAEHGSESAAAEAADDLRVQEEGPAGASFEPESAPLEDEPDDASALLGEQDATLGEPAAMALPEAAMPPTQGPGVAPHSEEGEAEHEPSSETEWATAGS